MYKKVKHFFYLMVATTLIVACSDRLDLSPEDERNTSDTAFDDPGSYKAF